MAAVGAEVTESSLSSGLVVSFILLCLFLFLVALCSECRRRSFELQDPHVERNPSALVRVVKLEEVKENPMIEEIQKDEKDLGPDEETPATFTPWRSHLMTPQSNDVDSFFSSDSAHIYDVIQRGRGNSSNAQPQPPPHRAAGRHEELAAHPVGTADNEDLVYARVNKKLPLNNSPVHTPEEEEEHREESSSPLPCTSTAQ